MLQSLNHIDHQLFFFLNGMHNPFFDSVMYQLTHFLVWIPLYLLILYLVIRHYKWQVLVVLLFVAVMILVSDQLCNIIKETVQRLRPSNDPALSAVHIVNGYRGGTYGFYSAHASNNFAVAVFLVVMIGNRFRYIIPIVLAYAVVISYTRIYLGVHYPGDTVCGALAGSVIGFILGKLCLRTIHFWLPQAGFFYRQDAETRRTSKS
jgi:undecaprenyl-diphosphatase